MAILYVKAIHDFSADSVGDLLLKKDDVVKVTKEIDQNWMSGSCRGKSGSFPRNYVTELTLPATRPGESVFVAIGNFPGEENGDLDFHKGDIVIGTSAVDDNWWNGRIGSRTGIFPLTHVEELSVSSCGITDVIATVEVTSNLKAQLDDELELIVGDIIEVTSVYGDGFAVGRNRGRTGQFPLSFVKVLSGDVSITKETNKPVHADFNWWKNTSEASQKPCFMKNTQEPISNEEKTQNQGMGSSAAANKYKSNNHNAASSDNNHDTVHAHSTNGYTSMSTGTSSSEGVTPYARTLYPFNASNPGEISFKENEIVKLIRHIDAWTEGEVDGCRGFFPTSYIDIIVDCERTVEPQQPISGDTYARVLYDFKGLSDNDLSLKEGDTVTVLRRIDANWFEAHHDDGRVGLCPVSYVELFTFDQSADIISTNSDDKTQKESRINSDNSSHTPQLSAGARSKESSAEPSASRPQKPSVKPKPRVSPEHQSRSVEVSGSQVDDMIKSKPINQKLTASARQNLADRGLSLDEMIRQQLVVGNKSSDSNTVGMRSASVIPQQPIRKISDPSGNGITNQYRNTLDSAAISSDLDIDWLVNREMSRGSSIDKPSNSHTLNESDMFSQSISAGSSTLPRPQGATKKKPPPPRPSVPLPPSSRSRSEWQKFEDEQMTGGGAGGGGVGLRGVRNVSGGSGNLIAFSPEESNHTDRMSIDYNTYSYLEGDNVYEPIGPHHPPAVPSRSSFPPGQWNPAGSGPGRPNPPPRPSVSQPGHQGQDGRLKQRELRSRIIAELMSTERDYLKSLELCMQAFAQTTGCPATLDLDVLLGNTADVIDLSNSLLGQLEVDVESKTFDKQIVGRCFVREKEELLKVYALYCQNHDTVLTLLKKYENQPEMQHYLGRVVETMRQSASVFDMGSVLIKPVQRVLKYPLLLSELYKSTEPDHFDYPHLASAVTAMTDVASSVNEYKRRKELVMKYKQESDKTIGDKIGNLTLRSTKKKFIRISQWMMGTQTVDENFNREEQKFKAVDSAVKSVTRDISQYLEHFEESLSCEEGVTLIISDYYAESADECEVEKLSQVYNKIMSKHFPEFKVALETEILPPLNSLLIMFQGPQKVIRKRYDKLLDYDNASARIKGSTEEQVNMDAEELQVVKRNYEALNSQLLEDLPRLFTLSLSILKSCLMRFSELQRILYWKISNEMMSLLGLKIVSNPGASGNIVESFNISHTLAVDELSSLSFIPRTFNPQVEEVKKYRDRRSTCGSISNDHLLDLDVSHQPASQLAALRQRYADNQLFVVTRSYSGGAPMDLTLRAGTVVGVIKQGDPMGNKDKWFVDDGASKGFIFKEYLAPQGSAGGQTGDLLGPLDTPLTPQPISSSNSSNYSSISSTGSSRLPSISEPCEKSRPNILDDKSHLQKQRISQSEEERGGVRDRGGASIGMGEENYEEMDPEFNAPSGIGGTKKYRPPVGDFFLTLSRGFTRRSAAVSTAVSPAGSTAGMQKTAGTTSGSTAVSTAGPASKNQVIINRSDKAASNLDNWFNPNTASRNRKHSAREQRAPAA